MSPGGHLTTAVALGGIAYAATGSPALVAGTVAGAFLIDGDHYLDYLIVEGQWRRPSPLAFLRYAFGQQGRRAVLPLHSLELMAVLTLLVWLWPVPALLGYLLGGMLHLLLDIAVNGEHLRRPLLFYCLAYRARHRFLSARLIAPVAVPPEAGRHLVREFFGRPPVGRPRDRATAPMPRGATTA